MHVPDEFIHLVDRGSAGLDHHVRTFAEDLKLGVSDQYSDLDKLIPRQVETGHFTVDPDQQVTYCHTACFLHLFMISASFDRSIEPIRSHPSSALRRQAPLAWSDRMRGESDFPMPGSRPRSSEDRAAAF